MCENRVSTRYPAITYYQQAWYNNVRQFDNIAYCLSNDPALNFWSDSIVVTDNKNIIDYRPKVNTPLSIEDHLVDLIVNNLTSAKRQSLWPFTNI